MATAMLWLQSQEPVLAGIAVAAGSKQGVTAMEHHCHNAEN